jgi:hypothetical protein
MTYMVEVASTERTFNALQNHRLKNAIKKVAPKVAPKNVHLVRTFCIVPERSFFAKSNSCPFSLRNSKTQRVLFYR